jgi:hypothetical protein
MADADSVPVDQVMGAVLEKLDDGRSPEASFDEGERASRHLDIALGKEFGRPGGESETNGRTPDRPTAIAPLNPPLGLELAKVGERGDLRYPGRMRGLLQTGEGGSLQVEKDRSLYTAL